MSEQQLAAMLVTIGLERGADIDQIADEIGRLTMPAFVDISALRAAALPVLEERLRAEAEYQIAIMRHRLAGDGVAPAPTPPVAPERLVGPVDTLIASPANPARVVTKPAVGDAPQPATTPIAAAETAAEDDAEPTSDGTMIWMSQPEPKKRQ
jgi:hypothetical protein